MIEEKELTNEILEVIKNEELYCITDIFAFYTRCSRATFYNRGLDKLDTIIKALDDNKIKTKQNLKKFWAKETASPVLQIGLYKLLGDNEERRKLSQSFQDHTSGGDKITGFIYADPNDKTDEETT